AARDLDALVRPAEARASVRRWPLAAFAALAASIITGVVITRDAQVRALPVPTPDRPLTIAVLPIQNETGDSTLTDLTTGLTEELIADMARIRSFRIPSAGAVTELRNRSLSLAGIASQVRANLLLTSSLSLIDRERIRLTARLVDPATARTVWEETFTRNRTQALAVQSEIARLVAARVSLRLAPAESHSLAARAVGADAGDAYLRGLVEAAAAGDDRQRKAVAYFQRAMDVEPAFARAWANMAQAKLS